MLKWQCYDIFDPFYQKTPPGPQMNRQKQFREIFRFHEDIFAKTCVPIVVDYTDMVSA